MFATSRNRPLRATCASPKGFCTALEGLLFLTSTRWISIDDIRRIEIGGGASRTFELQVELHSGTLVEFTIDRSHEEAVRGYIVAATGGWRQPSTTPRATATLGKARWPDGEEGSSEEGSESETEEEDVAR